MAVKIAPQKQDSAIGLDIGSYSIKCVELTSHQDKIRLQRVSILPINSEAPEKISQALKVIFDGSPSASRRVRISVSGGGSSLLIRRIQLPNMTPQELRGAIRFEAEGHIPFPIDECQIDFQILNVTPDKKSMNVLLVAAKKAFIKERLKLVEAAGISPEVIDVDIFCLINAYEILGRAPEENSFGLVNIGHKVTSFAIIQDRVPFFVREIPFGASSITRALSEAKGISLDDAEAIKLAPTPEQMTDLRQAVVRGFEPLVEEMHHSIDYVENETGEELPAVWLSGGGALCAGAPEVLSEELGKKVSRWDNTKRMEVFGDIDQAYLNAHSAELNVALGMVLRRTWKK